MRPVLARIVVIAAAASLVAVGVAGAGVGRWGPSHGPEGGYVNALVVDPSSSSVVYAATDHGVFKSTNAGARWRAVQQVFATSVGALAVDPRQPDVVYAGTDGGTVLKSTDAGRTWHAAGKQSLRVGWVNTLAIDPLRTSTVYVGGQKGLFKTDDGGRTWRSLNTGLTKRIVGAIAIDPRTPSTLYVGASRASPGPLPTGIFKSTDGGASWREVHTGLSGGMCGIVIDPADPATLYAGGQRHTGEVGLLFKSVDRGESWTPIPGDGCSSLAVDFTRTPNVIYAVSSRSGPVKSSDGGVSWTQIGKRLPPVWLVQGLVIDPNSPGTLYVTPGDFGVFRTTDGGGTWQASNRGLVGRRIRSLAVHPLDGRTVYAGTAGGIHRSTDGGASWEAPRLPAVWVNALALDPSRPSRMYAGGANGVYRSTDSGRSWRSVRTPLFKYGASALTFDPKDPSILYARAANVWLPGRTWRFVRSVDSGKSWRVLKPGLPGRWVDSIAVDPHDTRILFAATWPTVRGGEFVGGGVFRSADGGRSWRAAGLSGHVVSSLAIDPLAPATVYAGTYGRVFKSTDGGTTWNRTMRSGLPNAAFACDVVLDPAVPNTVYAACGPRVYRSTSGGRRWRPLGGVVPGDVLRLAIDSSGRTLYAGTDAGLSDYRFPR